MTDRDRQINVLAELLENLDDLPFYTYKDEAEYLIDEYGVIVPPCKVGQTVYVDADTWGYDFLYFESRFIHSKYFLIGEIVSIIKTKKQLLMKIRVSNSIHTRYKHQRYTVNALGKTVFLTKEEAEAELEKRCNNAR